MGGFAPSPTIYFRLQQGCAVLSNILNSFVIMSNKMKGDYAKDVSPCLMLYSGGRYMVITNAHP
jgi:hypothetical protein